MKIQNLKWILVGAAVLFVGGLAAYQFTGGREYSSSLDSLRAQFNADKGKPRLLVLLSPT